MIALSRKPANWKLQRPRTNSRIFPAQLSVQLVHDAQPELGALGLLDPDAENLLRAGGQDAERDVAGLGSRTKPSSLIFTRIASKKTSG
jgi:hypothetical protein